jgi:hypothetical protein
MNAEAAETIALQALGWLASNDELCPIFLGSSGASVDDLKAQAGDPVFLASVLEFVTMDDQWVVAMCDTLGIGYDVPLRARYALQGAEQTHWT